MLTKKSLVIGGAIGAGLFLALALVFAGTLFKRSPASASNAWHLNIIKATYVASQLRQIDKAHAALFLAYDLENGTDLDYRLDESSGVIIMSKLKSDGSLSQEEPVRLSYSVFLPARQRVRIAIEVLQPFVWPSPGDSQLDGKLREFVKQRLANTDEFVLFGEPGHFQVELPSAWEALEAANGVNNSIPAALEAR